MSAEFLVQVTDHGRYRQQLRAIAASIRALPTYLEQAEPQPFHLRGLEPRDAYAWAFDARVWLEPDHLFLELSAHPPSIETDLARLLKDMRTQCGEVIVTDEDGEPAGW